GPDGDSPGLVSLDRLRVETTGPGRRRMRHDVLVDPHDRVADGDGQPLRLVPHRLDGHRVGLWFALGSRRDARVAHDQAQRGGQYRDPHGQCALFIEACSPFACSRCATNAGRTLISSAFSSPFAALGIRVVSSASMTCWWYAIS